MLLSSLKSFAFKPMQSRGQQEASALYILCWVGMRPRTLCCGACTCTNMSSSSKIQRNCKRLKITVCMGNWGKLWTIRYKTASSEEPGAKAEYWPTPPVHTTTKGAGRQPMPTPWPNPWAHSPPHPLEGISSPFWGSEQAREPVDCSPSPLLQQGPHNAEREFPAWLLINFYWLRKPRILVGNRKICWLHKYA